MITVVILSKKVSNLIPCVDSIAELDPAAEILVVDDGLEFRPERENLLYIDGIKPFIFARNANLGIRAAYSDVILMNDDAVLRTPNGFSEMNERRPAGLGIVSAAIAGPIGNVWQAPANSGGYRYEPRTLAFVAVLIPRVIFEALGRFDERFNRYGSEDNDYCRRALDAGFKLAIDDLTVVEHEPEGQSSTFRETDRRADLEAARQIYAEKWGERP